MDAVVQTTEVREAQAGDAARWDAFVADAPGGTFFHRYGWKPVIERSLGHRCFYFFTESHGRITGIFPLTFLNSRLFGKSLVSCAFGVTGGPVAESGDERRRLVSAALSLGDRLDVDFIECRTGRDALPGPGEWRERADLYVNFSRSITADHDANLKAVPRKQRAMIRKGIKHGLVGEIDADARRLHDIYAESVRNLGTPVFSRRYFEALKSEFGSDCEVLTIRDGGTAVSSVMSFYFRDEVLPYYGGGRAAARAVAANDFMYWEVMRRAADRGMRSFDFGRSKAGTGAYAFKKNWGFQPVPLSYSYHLRHLAEVPQINPTNPKYQLAIAAWKRLPVPLTKMIGPPIARCLG